MDIISTVVPVGTDEEVHWIDEFAASVLVVFELVKSVFEGGGRDARLMADPDFLLRGATGGGAFLLEVFVSTWLSSSSSLRLGMRLLFSLSTVTPIGEKNSLRRSPADSALGVLATEATVAVVVGFGRTAGRGRV